MPEFSKDWFSWNIPSWQEHLLKFKDKPYLHFLEIGCFEGRATLWLLENILTRKNSKIDCIDPFVTDEEYDNIGRNTMNTFLKNTTKYQDQINLYVTTSNRFKPEQDYYHFVYVDGSHTAPDCLADMVKFFPTLKKGGIMIIDDYRWDAKLPETEKPAIAVDAFQKVYAGKFRTIHRDYQVIMEKL